MTLQFLILYAYNKNRNQLKIIKCKPGEALLLFIMKKQYLSENKVRVMNVYSEPKQAVS